MARQAPSCQREQHCAFFVCALTRGNMAKFPDEKQVLPGVFITDFRGTEAQRAPSSASQSCSEQRPELLYAEIQRLQHSSAVS